MDTRKFAMNYGAVLGLGLVAIALLFWMLGVDEQQSIIPALLNNGLTIGFLVYAIIQYRDLFNEGFITYSASLKLGTTVAFFSSVIMAFYTFIYITYLNPDFLANILNITEQAMFEADPEISDDQLDLALSMTTKFMQPHWMMIMSVLGGTFMGFIFSLIISIFVKKEIDIGEGDFGNLVNKDNENIKKNNNYSSRFLLGFFIFILLVIVTLFQKIELGGIPTAIFYLVIGLLVNFAWKKYKK